MDTARIQQRVDKMLRNREIRGVQLWVERGSETGLFSAGELGPEQPYFIASTTKLYITALIFRFDSLGWLKLDDPIHRYLPESVMKGLHVLNGVDYSRDITIRHLLSQRSGLPDYFLDAAPGKKSLEKELISGKDSAWTFEEAIDAAKRLRPHFKPGSRKAYYTDTNFQLLGKILEEIRKADISRILEEEIFTPLGLSATYLYADPADSTPWPLRYKKDFLRVPRAMASFGPDGSIVSTARETGVFLKAFFQGKLFPESYLKEQEFYPVMYPIEYGTGMMRFQLPAWMTLFRKQPALLGHSGLSGAFAFYVPEKDLYLCGTVNQINKPGNSFRLMIKLMNDLK